MSNGNPKSQASSFKSWITIKIIQTLHKLLFVFLSIIMHHPEHGPLLVRHDAAHHFHNPEQVAQVYGPQQGTKPNQISMIQQQKFITEFSFHPDSELLKVASANQATPQSIEMSFSDFIVFKNKQMCN